MHPELSFGIRDSFWDSLRIKFWDSLRDSGMRPELSFGIRFRIRDSLGMRPELSSGIRFGIRWGFGDAPRTGFWDSFWGFGMHPGFFYRQSIPNVQPRA